MKILALGGDGYLGWPMALALSADGHDVAIADNFVRRAYDLECDIEPLLQLPPMTVRLKAWKRHSGKKIRFTYADLRNLNSVYRLFSGYKPDAVIHFAEQRSAPYSMIDADHAVYTQVNNISGTINVLYALKKYVPHCHMVKLGTMGEYGTPNIDIEEGYIIIDHNGRTDTLPFPKQANSFYHLSKVHDSHNILFAARVWQLVVTDINQGVVYGAETEETKIHDDLRTRFDYDELFGTVVNRFCVQAATNDQLSVYGKGGQTRSLLHIQDTIQSIRLVLANPPKPGQCRVVNQFTDVCSVNEIADRVNRVSREMGLKSKSKHIHNPRIEKESHYYNPINITLTRMGLRPHPLSDDDIREIINYVLKYKGRIRKTLLVPRRARWH